jgi:hypothetical protein
LLGFESLCIANGIPAEHIFTLSCDSLQQFTNMVNQQPVTPVLLGAEAKNPLTWNFAGVPPKFDFEFHKPADYLRIIRV